MVSGTLTNRPRPNDNRLGGLNPVTGGAWTSKLGIGASLDVTTLVFQPSQASKSAILTITNPQPANNYRAGAHPRESVANTMKLGDDGVTLQFRTGGPTFADMPGEEITNVLEVWRFLHLETDSMAAPDDPGDGPFGPDPAPDDEDPGNIAGISPSPIVVEKFFEANIWVYEIYDDCTAPDVCDDSPFRHNVGKDATARSDAASIRDHSNDEWFWVVQTLAAYEPEDDLDFDPEYSNWQGGYSFENDNQGNGAFVILLTEVARDLSTAPASQNPPWTQVTIGLPTLLQRMLLHELGHQMGGFWHDRQSPFTVKDEGPMSRENVLRGDESANMFTPRQLGRIQTAIKPGVYTDEPMQPPSPLP
jgi:hypothetical protein